MEASKDGNPVGLPDWSAVVAANLHEFLQAFPSRHHVHHVAPDLDYELLRQHDPRARLLPEGMAPEVVVAVESNPGDTFVELDHLPHRVQGDAPRKYHH